jgi:hypothetical protein
VEYNNTSTGSDSHTGRAIFFLPLCLKRASARSLYSVVVSAFLPSHSIDSIWEIVPPAACIAVPNARRHTYLPRGVQKRDQLFYVQQLSFLTGGGYAAG